MKQGKMQGDIHSMKGDIRQLNENMGHIAQFVGEDRTRQNIKIEEIDLRVKALERKAA